MTLQPGKLILAKDFRAFNPSDIETALWLDAADASTITESGGAVSQWNDKRGNGRIAFYSIGSNLNLAKLDTRVTDLITAIGAAIP